jgi:hypothetical protein
MKVTIKKHWKNHEPTETIETKKDALKCIENAFFNTNTESTLKEFIEDSEITKLKK